MALDWPTLRTLAHITDDVGVLSLYTTADPHDETSRPAWQTRARTSLRQLPDQVKAHRARDEWLAVKARLDSLSTEFEQVLSARAPGVGRALFAPVSNGRVEIVSVQVPLVDKVDIAPMAQLRPLLCAWSEACPAGAVAVGPDELRIIDVRLGRSEHVATIEHPDDPADRRVMKGPAHSNPSMAQQTSPLVDVFDRREEFRLHRYLHSVGPTIASLAADRGWDCLAVTGEIALAQAVARGMPHNVRLDVMVLPHAVGASITTHKLGSLVEPALIQARQQRNRRLVQYAHDAALAARPGPGAVGLEATLAALQQGQVARLLMARGGSWQGLRASDGTLVASHDADASNRLAPESHLDERMIELALRNNANITMLDDVDAESLGAERIGAILRWSPA